MGLGMPWLHLNDGVCPSRAGVLSPLFPDRGGTQEHAMYQKELDGCELVGLQRRDKPGSGTVIECKSPHGAAGWG